jgi:hypothetical protein
MIIQFQFLKIYTDIEKNLLIIIGQTKKMDLKEEVAEKINKSIKENNLSEFEKIISGISANNLGEKVIQKLNQKRL